MRKYRGPVLEVSPVTSMPGPLGGWMIDTIRIGGRTLRHINCDDIMARELRPSGDRDVCLYVQRLPIDALPWPLTPHLLGIKYPDTGERHVIPFGFALNSCIRFAVIPALVWSIFGGIAAAIVASVLGVTGVITNEMFLAGMTGLTFFGGLFLAWGCSLSLALGYLRARIG